MMLEHPIYVFDMDIEAPTPSENYIPLDTSEILSTYFNTYKQSFTFNFTLTLILR